MNITPFEHDPLENFFRALESTDDTDDLEIKSSLQARGLDPDKTTAAVSANVHDFLKRHRLSWQELAKQKQANLQAAAARVVSWTKRKREDIEKAFGGVQDGSYGPAAQMKLRVAFRNLHNVPLEDKATFLDEIDTLRQLMETEASKGPQS